MNQVFSLNRCLLLIAKHWSENRKKYSLGVLAILGIMIVWFTFYTMMEPQNPMPDGLQLGTFFIGLFAVGCLYASTLFADLGSKSRGTNYLSLPASQLEKTVCTLIYGVVIFFVVYVVLFYVADILMVNIANSVAHAYWVKHHGEGSIFEPQKVLNVFGRDLHTNRDDFNIMFFLMLGYFAVQSAFLLGSVYFTRYSFIKTTVGLLFVWLLIILYLAKVLHSFMPDGNFYEGLTSYRLNGQEDGTEKIIRLPEWTTNVTLFLVKYAFAPVFWIATYYRVKEKEI